MKDVLFFNSMLTPQIITIVYWVLLVSVVVGGIGAIFSGKIIAGVVGVVIGVVAVRIWCELLIILFKINDNLKVIAEK